MSAILETKYTTVGVETEDEDIKQMYFGYIAINFKLATDEDNFFAETFEVELLDKIKKFFHSVPNVMVDKDIRLEDAVILIDLPSKRSKIYATDVYKIVMDCEKQFKERTGL